MRENKNKNLVEQLQSISEKLQSAKSAFSKNISPPISTKNQLVERKISIVQALRKFSHLGKIGETFGDKTAYISHATNYRGSIVKKKHTCKGIDIFRVKHRGSNII